MKHIKLVLSISILLASGSVKAQDTTSFTLRQVYDFNVGDEFHIEAYNSSISFIKRQVTERTFVNSDSISYTYKDSIFVVKHDPMRTAFDRVKEWSEGYGHLDSVISYPKDSIFGYYDGRRQIITYVSAANDFCEVEGIEHTEIIFPFNPEGHIKKTFYIGLGSFETIWYGQGGGYRYTLMYYKKGSIECGNPITLSVQNMEYRNLKIYPNPANNTLFIEDYLPDTEFVIYNAHGEKVESGRSTKTIDISLLKSGLFFIEISTKSKILRARFIKE
jgi:hypothetical protein